MFELRKSKLECYEEILGVLVKGPATVDSIAYETDMNCAVLKQRLDFLIENGLVEERVFGRKTKYAVTERGVAVYKTLNFQRYLEKVASAIRVMDEAMEVIPKISEREKRES